MVSQLIQIYVWYLYHSLNESSEQRKSSNRLYDDWNNHKTYSIGGHEDDTGDGGLWLTTLAMPWSLLYIYLNITVYTILFLRYGGVWNNSINDDSLMNKQ